MKKKTPLFAGIAIMLVLLFLLSFAITKKTVSDKALNETESQPSESESSADVGTSQSSNGAEASEITGSENVSSEQSADNALPTPTVINMPTDDTWCLVLLNKYYKMNDTYEPLVDKISEDSVIYLDARVAVKFNEMSAAAASQGITLTPAAGYVSTARQQRKFEKQVESYVADGMSEAEAIAKTAFTVLPAGCSESNYGLAVDIGWLAEDFSGSPMYTWLRENAAAYGFVERYPSGKTDITKFTAQPWHWRYVGVDAAKEMVEKGLCLEEYLGKVN